MKLYIARETWAGETRVPMVPAVVAKLAKLGVDVFIEDGLGAVLGIENKAYAEAGAVVADDPKEALAEADLVLRLRPPTMEFLAGMKRGGIVLGYFDPFNQGELLAAAAAAGVTAISVEMIPRTTLAQKMDALSSQANIGGYVAVILAAERSDKVLPMMITPAGTISPARVFVIGAGVAGLQAIATAKRLGARVEAFDTRPVVEEQVLSLGAKFVKVDLGETGQTADGYAKALTEEQLARQQAEMARHCAAAEIVITTAQVFGRPAPRIVTEEMVAAMKPGSVIVDMAVETGGNVAGSKLDEEVMVGGVRIVGLGNLPGRAARDASEMYANNVGSFVTHFWDREAKCLALEMDNEIIKGSMLTHGGAVVHPAFAGRKV